MKVGKWIGVLVFLEGLLSCASSSDKYINTACQANSDCGLDNHLQCISNYCQCDSHTQIYDQSTHKCLLLIGEQCQSPVYTATSTGQYYPERTNPPIKCVPNGECTKSVCRCRQGYRTSLDLLCKPDYGSPCHAKDDCDENLGLVCSQGICQCFNNTWSYQGQFGCVDPKDPTYNEMLRLLNQTHHLLKENNLEIKDMFNDLGLQNDPNAEYIFGNAIADERQFRDTYNTQDLQFAAQNQSPQFNLQQLLGLFQTLQSLIPRNNNNNNNNNNGGGGGGGGGGRGLGFGRGFFRNLFGGGNNQGGYPENTTPASGYGAPGQPEGMSQRMGLINSFLNLFNQLIPVVRQLRMRFSPLRFIQNLINRFAPSTTEAPPPAPAIQNPPPTVIQSSGNYQNNPIFDSNNPDSNQNAQGQGTFRFFMRSRDRFRNLLRGNQGQGGYPTSPPSKYGAPPSKYGAPAAEGEAPPPPPEGGADSGDAPAGSSNFFTNNPPPAPRPAPAPGTFRVQQQEFNTITVGVAGRGIGSSSSSSSSTQTALQRHERQPNFQASASTYNPGHNVNHQSFFNGQSQQSQHHQSASFRGAQPQHQQPQQSHIVQNHQSTTQTQPHQQFHNNQLQHTTSNSNNYNAQATSHQQSTFLPHPQPPNVQTQLTQFQRPPSPEEPPSVYSDDHNQESFSSSASNANVPPSVHSIISTPPPIPRFKLPVPSQKSIVHESLTQNYILSEADDPHPGFTPHSTPAPLQEQSYQPQQYQQSFRTSARFERIGEEEDRPNTAAQNWRESF